MRIKMFVHKLTCKRCPVCKPTLFRRVTRNTGTQFGFSASGDVKRTQLLTSENAPEDMYNARVYVGALTERSYESGQRFYNVSKYFGV